MTNQHSKAASPQVNLAEVAVIVPTYNRWPTVSEAIDSVLSQDYAATRCIVVDDSSTDGSAEQIERHYGDRVTLLVNDTNREKSSCRNRGVSECQSEFVCFLDSDDLLTPNAVADRMRVFQEDPDFDGVAFGARVDEKNAKDPPPSMPATLTLEAYLKGFKELHTNSYMLRREAMLQSGMYDERLTNREDVELFIRLLATREFRSCASLLTICRSGAAARAREDWGKIIEQGTSMTDVLFEHRELMPVLGKYYRQLRADEYHELLRALYRQARYRRYRHTYRVARAEGVLPWSMKAFRRYCLAGALGFVQS